MNWKKSLPPELRAYKDEAITIRRALHRIPESGFEETQTRDWIVNYLQTMGYQPEVIVKTGVSLYIPARDESACETIAFRADMDGLPIEEPQTTDFASCHQGMMHACGHDGHMTMLLLLAKVLHDDPQKRVRNVLLIFQPAEEGPGGAKPVAESGIFEKYNVAAVFGYHLFPFIPEGVIATSPGPIIAMNSEIYIDIYGQSGHAANPDQGIDAIVAAAQLVSAVQSIVSRSLSPKTEAVVHLGTIHGGSRMNVIADHVALTGTMRSYDEAIHHTIQNRLGEMARGIETMTRVKIDLKFIDMYPPVVNDDHLYAQVWPLLGDESQRMPFKKLMIAEDFAFYGHYRPSLFMGLGCQNEEKGYTSGLHTATFQFDETVLLRGLAADLAIIGAPQQY
ncbi:MAG: M20 family metallopeptidase [Eubacteriaceae bacterium]|nr:M20 family metallopeptidase [Eubacteriaceae bacterium]